MKNNRNIILILKIPASFTSPIKNCCIFCGSKPEKLVQFFSPYSENFNIEYLKYDSYFLKDFDFVTFELNRSLYKKFKITLNSDKLKTQAYKSNLSKKVSDKLNINGNGKFLLQCRCQKTSWHFYDSISVTKPEIVNKQARSHYSYKLYLPRRRKSK